MGKARLTETQILEVLKEFENGKSVDELCDEYGISKTTFYNWKRKYEGLEAIRQEHIKEPVSKSVTKTPFDKTARVLIYIPLLVIATSVVTFAFVQLLDLCSYILGSFYNSFVLSASSFIFALVLYLIGAGIILSIARMLLTFLGIASYYVIIGSLKGISPSEKFYEVTVFLSFVINAIIVLWTIWTYQGRHNISYSTWLIAWNIVATLLTIGFYFIILNMSWLKHVYEKDIL